MEWDDYPLIGSTGACHTLADNGEDRSHRFWNLKSTSAAAAKAYSIKPAPIRRPIGFRIPRTR